MEKKVFEKNFVKVLTFLERNLHTRALYVLHGFMLEWACRMFTRLWQDHDLVYDELK